MEDKAIVDELRGEVDEAETIVFLGFAFHPQNMRLIAQPSDGQVARGKRVFATAVGFSSDDISVIKRQIVGLFVYPEQVNSTIADDFFEELHIRPVECGSLVREHRRGLSLI
jgi:hypothetical protein